MASACWLNDILDYICLLKRDTNLQDALEIMKTLMICFLFHLTYSTINRTILIYPFIFLNAIVLFQIKILKSWRWNPAIFFAMQTSRFSFVKMHVYARQNLLRNYMHKWPKVCKKGRSVSFSEILYLGNQSLIFFRRWSGSMISYLKFLYKITFS